MSNHKSMQKIFHSVFLLIISILLFSSCSHNPKEENEELLPAAPDYTQQEMWYQFENQQDNKDLDVFYIISTCSFDWRDSLGRTVHYMNVYDSAQRAYLQPYFRQARELFSPSCRFFAPYYRQITLESWGEDSAEVERRYLFAHQDVATAFRYYMKYCNHGRPFILAGFSQGAKAVVELLKHEVTQEEYARMVAAYVFGYRITAEELACYPLLKPVDGADDQGVICFNSVSDPAACSSLFSHNSVCINPLNWSYDTTYAPAALNLGSVFMQVDGTCDTLHCVGARIDAATHSLVIDGLNDDDYFVPTVEHLFAKGNYHLYEQFLYYLNIQKNISDRYHHFIKQ